MDDIFPSNGIGIRFSEKDIRTMGRVAAGVRGIRLKENDFLVGAGVLEENSKKTILTVTENGYGKRSSAEDYRIQKRGGKGVFAIKSSKRNGNVIGSMIVDEDQEVILIADSGKMIRMPLDTIRVIGRTTKGVKLINIELGEKVVGMDIIDIDQQDDENGDDE
jgi:DNA gyrase subunit A